LWHDLTKGDEYTAQHGIKVGIGPDSLPAQSRPVWLEGSKTLAASIQNASAAMNYKALVKTMTDLNLPVPTPDTAGSPCGGNGDTALPQAPSPSEILIKTKSPPITEIRRINATTVPGMFVQNVLSPKCRNIY